MVVSTGCLSILTSWWLDSFSPYPRASKMEAALLWPSFRNHTLSYLHDPVGHTGQSYHCGGDDTRVWMLGSGDHWGHFGSGQLHHFSLRFDPFRFKTLHDPALPYFSGRPMSCWIIKRVNYNKVSIGISWYKPNCWLWRVYGRAIFKEAGDEAIHEGQLQDSLVSIEKSEKGDNKRKGMEKRSKLGLPDLFLRSPANLVAFTFTVGGYQDCSNGPGPAEASFCEPETNIVRIKDK